MKKTIQYFSKDYLKRCAVFTPDQIIEFLENYRHLVAKTPEKCQLISLKIQPSLLNAFKKKANLEGSAYQTKIKQLMWNWIVASSE